MAAEARDPNLLFQVGPNIRNVGMPKNSPFLGKYFIYGKTAGNEKSSWYLHPDGVWRNSVVVRDQNGQEEWSGYYDSAQAAQAVFDRYLSQRAPAAA